MDDTCPHCGALPEGSGGTTLLRCNMCGARFLGNGTTTIELSVRTNPGQEVVDSILELDPEFRARYHLDRVIGTGGMGMVLLAHEVAADRKVAIKFMRMLEHAELADRFQREARIMLALKHPNVVELYSVDQVADHPVLVMEYLAGGTLKERLQTRKRLPPVEAVETILPVLAGLAALHRGGVIHRDLKPENVLFSDHGVPKIADLGIAKDYGDAQLTATGQVLGTPIYMSPEQARGEDPSVASDIYAIGCMLYELLAGSPPFDTLNPLELIRLHQTTAPPPLSSRVDSVPSKLASVVHRALSKAAVERPAGCEDLCILLERAIGRQAPRALGDISGAKLPIPKRPLAEPASSTSNPIMRRNAPAAAVLSPGPSATPVPAFIPAPPVPAASTPTAAPPAATLGTPQTPGTQLNIPAPAHRIPRSAATSNTLIQKPVPIQPLTPFWTCAINDAAPTPLAPDPLFIGRTPGPSEIILDDPGVSYRHALLVPEHTELKLFDFRSTNGLSVNGRPLEQHTLGDGDVVTMGSHRLTFRRTSAAYEPASQPAFALPPATLVGWLEAEGDARDRFGLLLDALMSAWALERAVLLAEHLASGTFQTLAARPPEATAFPTALRQLPTARLYGGSDPVLIIATAEGRPAALVPLRAGGVPRGQLYLEAGATSPQSIFAADGIPTLQGLASVLALGMELALPRVRDAEERP